MSTKRPEGAVEDIICRKCGASDWEYDDDSDYQDYVVAKYGCTNCGYHIYIELPD